MPNYYTYKDQVPLEPGQTLGFTSGKGYYAAGTPTPTQATKETTAAPPSVERPLATPAQMQPVAANAAQVARQTTAAPPSVEQPVATPVAANSAQVTKNTTGYPNRVQPVAAAAQTQPASANASQVARETTAAAPTVDRLVATPTEVQPVPANVSQVVRETIAYSSDTALIGGYGVTYYTFRTQVALKPGETIGFTRGKGYYAIPGTATIHSLQPTKPGTPIPHPSDPLIAPSARVIQQAKDRRTIASPQDTAIAVQIQAAKAGTEILKADPSGPPLTQEDRRLAGAAPGGKTAKPLTPLEAKKANAVVADAVREAGRPYVTGGRSPSVGFDCSGLVQWAYGQVGINLPAPSQNQYAILEKYGAKVPLNKIEPGDIVFYRGETDQPSPAHVGIYAGHGEVMQALGHAWGVHEWSLTWAGPPVAVYRIIGQ